MRAIVLASALSIVAVAPAAAQMAPMSSVGGGQSCVSGGQFVPCPPGGGMQPGPMAPNPLAAPGMVAGAAVGAATGVVAGAAAGVGAGVAAGAGAVEEPRMRRKGKKRRSARR